ncbi:hypothetical protein [Phycicoccus duodecadis]|uniref:Uncharacterized protein n=1 Tax=Phycicoccus duodecadis TaxID=173053 RepID=A0A2N3YL75_9MICO|nr:hypothetical protein [Phycicoccus duodecadis]PKW27616.1 hypothetical protein ATL31_2466 [Phycicoccus duodecadis]
MEIPQHWVRVEGFSPHLGERGGPLSVWGWSETSDQDAERVGRERLAETLARVEREGRLAPGHGYYPRTPLREPLLEEVGPVEGAGGRLGVVTRNRMGCEVLCTESLLIADVDVEELAAEAQAQGRRGARARASASARGGGIGAFLRRAVLGRPDPAPMTPGTQDAAGLDGPSPAGAPHGPGYHAYPSDEGGAGVRVTPTGPERPSVAECLAAEPAWGLARSHPELGVRVYRTAAGLRVVVTGADAPPTSARARDILTALGTDPLYLELCATHASYRARLTPKPFRVGMPALPVRWPCADDAEERRWLRWVDEYERAAAAFAVCRLVSASGPVPSAAEQRLVELHDERSGVGARLPLA